MPKNTNKTKKPGQILIWQQIKKIRIFQLFDKILPKEQSLNQTRHCFTGHNQIWHHFFYQKKVKYFNDLQNWNFSVLWLKWTQTMEMKQNQTFFHGSN